MMVNISSQNEIFNCPDENQAHFNELFDQLLFDVWTDVVICWLWENSNLTYVQDMFNEQFDWTKIYYNPFRIIEHYINKIVLKFEYIIETHHILMS